MARAAHKLLADMRAMEEEGERTNPINPKKAIAGAGATPSMGLSQFRGGKHTLLDHLKAPTKGFGKKKAAPCEAESDGEDAEGAGRMLGQTLHKLHGGKYLAAFHRGMGLSGGINTGAYEGEGKAGGSLHGGFWGTLASVALPLISNLFGSGKMDKEAHDKLTMLFSKKSGGSDLPRGDAMLSDVADTGFSGFRGAAHSGGAFVGGAPAGGKKRRAAAGPSDKRRARGAKISKLMKEKGMTLAEASKYLKAHPDF